MVLCVVQIVKSLEEICDLKSTAFINETVLTSLMNKDGGGCSVKTSRLEHILELCSVFLNYSAFLNGIF